MLKFLKNNWFLKDFGISRGGRAHVARMVLFDRDSCKKVILDQRMCTAWYHLTGMSGGVNTGIGRDSMISCGHERPCGMINKLYHPRGYR